MQSWSDLASQLGHSRGGADGGWGAGEADPSPRHAEGTGPGQSSDRTQGKDAQVPKRSGGAEEGRGRQPGGTSGRHQRNLSGPGA